MSKNNDNNEFSYSYSAPTNSERKEIESIRKAYMPKNSRESKLELLRKLDSIVNNVPMAVGIMFGVIGTLIFGLGLTMILEWQLIVWGVVVSIVGIVPIGIAYPAYLKTTKHLKNKYSNQILKLSDELLGNKNTTE